MTTRLPWRVEAVLLGSGMYGNVAMSALSPALPKIAQSFSGLSHPEYWAKMAVSAVGLGVILISPFTGSLVGRFGRRPVMVGAYIAFLIFGLSGMFIPSLPLLIVTRFITGGAGAVAVATGLILIGDHYAGLPRERRIGMSHAVGALLTGLAIQIAGFLADIDWHYAFLVHLTALPLLFLALASPELDKPEIPGAARPPAGRLPPFMWLIGLTALVAGGIGYSVQIFTPFHLRNIGANSSALAGTAIVITLIGSMVTALFYGEVRRWLSASTVFAVAFLGWSAGLAMTALTHTVSSTLAAMAIIGLSGGIIGPNIFALISEVTPDPERPRAIGLAKGIYYFGPFIGPATLQLLSLQNQAETALISLAVFGTGFAALCWVTGFIFRASQRSR
jgi:MFS family permease